MKKSDVPFLAPSFSGQDFGHPDDRLNWMVHQPDSIWDAWGDWTGQPGNDSIKITKLLDRDYD